MKKVSLIAMMALVPVCGAMAGPGMKKHTNTTTPMYWSVTEIVDMPEDTPVVLRGRIKQNMGNEMYLFEDASGTIMLEIDDSDWNGNTVRVDDVVTVYGNIDKNGTVTEVDVVSIEK